MGKQAAAGLVILFLTACAAPRPEVAPTPTTTVRPASTTNVAGTTITTGPSDFGTMLFDTRNQAIYLWEVETTPTPACYDDCEIAWPPVLTTGDPVAAGDVRQDLLGTTGRRDGTTQVTYNGHPLYYYANEGPGEVECHNITTHGGVWWVVQPDGNPAP